MAEGLNEKLAALKTAYAARLEERIEEIAGTAGKLREGDREALRGLRNLVHKLAGSGATFGFGALSAAARRFEEAADRCLETGGHAPEGMAALLADLRAAAAIPEPEPQEAAPVPAGQRAESVRRILLVEPDPAEAGSLARELTTFGFAVRTLSRIEDLASALATAPPAAVIIDMSGHGNENAVVSMRQLRAQERLTAPVIFISADGGVEARLAAIRAGAQAFLVKPVIPTGLVDVLDPLTLTEEEPFRVLIIDDDKSMARYSETILENAGMIAESVTNPLSVLDRLDAFAPELVLVDLYMPQCDGHELAAVIRQQEAFAGLPIVFLSGERDVDRQLGALDHGGDDFLIKPIRPHHLIAAVRMRARRFRTLRSLMVRDSLTGLLNHTTTMQFLTTEIARARRNSQPLSVAALDIDHFKAVNDTHGHAIGDQVIKGLARLLRQRLRSTDAIGRMGGEEFAAILPGTPLAQAETVFEEIRDAFSRIRNVTASAEFSSTLSCGVAVLEGDGTPASLMEAADHALYIAKRGGRNRVVAASPGIIDPAFR